MVYPWIWAPENNIFREEKTPIPENPLTLLYL